MTSSLKLFEPPSAPELDAPRSTILTDDMVAELARVEEDPAAIVEAMALSTEEIRAFMAQYEGLTTDARGEVSKLLHAAEARAAYQSRERVTRVQRVLVHDEQVIDLPTRIDLSKRPLSHGEFVSVFSNRMLGLGMPRRLAVDIARAIPPDGHRASPPPPGTFGLTPRTPFWTVHDEDLKLAESLAGELTGALAAPILAGSIGESDVASIVGIVLDAGRVARRAGAVLEPLQLSLLLALCTKQGGVTVDEATKLLALLRDEGSLELEVTDVSAMLAGLSTMKHTDGGILSLVTESSSGCWQVVEHDRMTEERQVEPVFETPGNMLYEILLDGPAKTSQGLYRLDHWAVRLGRDPQSLEARMASLHEMYHGYLNDSTSFGSLLQVVGMLCREHPEKQEHSNLLRELIHESVVVQELYATYASSFLVGRGRPDPALLVDYGHEYGRFLQDALKVARLMPNPVLSFRLVETLVRAAMQPDCLAPFIDTPPSLWDLDMIDARELPNARLRVLKRPKLLETLVDRLQEWSTTQTSADIREVFDSRPQDAAAYNRLIEARLDHATDTIGGFMYHTCRDLLRASGLSCLDFNGHQAFTATLLSTAEDVLPEDRRGQTMVPAPEGSKLEDLLGGFADERLVVNPRTPEGSWFWLDETPAERWTALLVGPTPHALLVVRPLDRIRQQFAFDGPTIPPSDDSGAVVAIRRRVVERGRPPVIEHAVVRSPGQLTLVLSQLATSGRVLASCSLSVLASPGWWDAWWPALKQANFATVLVDTSPFNQLRAWGQQTFETSFATMTMKGRDRDHLIFTLHPHVDEGLTFIAPCSSVVSSALKVEIEDLNAKGGRFKEDVSVVSRDVDDLSLTISHVLQEEPWFDFRADKDRVVDPER